MERNLDTRTKALLRSPWKALLERALGPSRKVPTMLSPEEEKLYFWLAAFWAEGAGEIVDLGCFAGGSTARLAEGLRVAGLESRVHGFDRFTAREPAKKGVLYKNGIAPFEGVDIFPLAQDLLSPWKEQTQLHRGEIDQMEWNGGAIEILVMDASKKAHTMDRMVEIFLPHLLPGRSLLVQQDFLHWSQPWVPVQMELLSACFTPLVHVPRDTVVYLCTSAPDAQSLEAARTAEMSDAEILDVLKAVQARFAASGWGLTERLEESVLGALANPGKRAAHQFRRP